MRSSTHPLKPKPEVGLSIALPLTPGVSHSQSVCRGGACARMLGTRCVHRNRMGHTVTLKQLDRLVYSCGVAVASEPAEAGERAGARPPQSAVRRGPRCGVDRAPWRVGKGGGHVS